MEGQIQCTRCEPSEGVDDELCCKPKRVLNMRNKYKSYNRRNKYKSYYRRNRHNIYNRHNRQKYI